MMNGVSKAEQKDSLPTLEELCIQTQEHIKKDIDDLFEKHREEMLTLKSANTPLKLFLYENKYQKFKDVTFMYEGEPINDPEVRAKYPELAYLIIRMVDEKFCKRAKISFPHFRDDVLTEIEKFVVDLEKEAAKGQNYRESLHYVVQYGMSVWENTGFGKQYRYDLSDYVINDTLTWFIGDFDEDPHKNNNEYVFQLTRHLYKEKRLFDPVKTPYLARYCY